MSKQERNNKKGNSRNYKDPKGYKPNHRNNKESSKTDVKELSKSMNCRENLDSITSNDIRWYNRSPLYPLATRIPWNQVMGANPEVQFDDFGYEMGNSMPGIMTIDFAPTVGWASDMNSAVNRAFNQLYSDIVSKTTGALQMQQMDLAIMTIGVSSIACHLGYAKKVMQCYQAYSSLNYYLPRPLINAMGFDFEDLVANAADYQIRLTDLITRFNRLAIPNFSDVHVRQYALSHNLYTDSETVFGQLINFRPNYIYRFEDTDHSLIAQQIWNVTDTWPTIKMSAYIENILQSLQRWENSSVTPIVAGNVRRAYPESALVKIDAFVPHEQFKATVDRNITWQVNNMRWHPVPTESLNITQDPVANVLICKPEWQFDTANHVRASNMNFMVLNSYDGDTSEEFAMEATRLVPTISVDVPEYIKSGKVYLTGCPSELVTRVTMFTRYIDTADGVAYVQPKTLNTSEYLIESATGAFTDFAEITGYVASLVKWRNGPGITIHWVDNDQEEQYKSPLLEPINSREIGLFTHLHQDQLDALHLAASQSLFWATDYKVGKSG